jgi:hypothetical protein
MDTALGSPVYISVHISGVHIVAEHFWYDCLLGIREKMGAWNIVQEIKQYQKKWLQYVQRMDRNRMPRQALQYRTEGRRNMG